jgi:hypothetical protein
VVEGLLSVSKGLGSIPSTAKEVFKIDDAQSENDPNPD